MIPSTCKSIHKEKLKTLKDIGKSTAIIKNDSQEKYTLVRIDGCVINDSIRCDYLIIDNANKYYYIELKGSDVKHAFSQISATIKHISGFSPHTVSGCFIVTTRCPLSQSDLQVEKLRFAKNHKCVVQVKNKSIDIIVN